MARKAKQFQFTVFTPTFNRARTLARVFLSLRAQTLGDFEWVIVDDGSTDDSGHLVNDWQRDAPFPIRYVKQPHRGKMAALNIGVEQARGELFLCLDSDDECMPNALERFLFHWHTIPELERAHYVGITGLCLDGHGYVIGDRFPQDVFDSDCLEISYKNKIRGEKWGFQRIDVMRRFPFPELPDAVHVPESIVWNAIARDFRTRFINEPLRIYHQGAPDQLASQEGITFARGLRLWYETVLNRDIDWFRHAPKEFVRSAVNYSRFSFHLETGLRRQGRALENRPARFLWGTTLPMAYAVYRRDRLRLKKTA